MNHAFFVSLATAAALLLFPGGLHALESDAETEARKVALEVAGAFSNDGFKLRDGHWSGSLEVGRQRLIEVNLYAGNQYWFSVGATAQATRLSIAIYDETGKAMVIDPYADASKAAAGFSPEISGPYYLKIQELEGQPSTFCLIYSYK